MPTKGIFFSSLYFGAGSSTAWTSLNTLAVEVVPDLRKPVASLYNSFKFTGYALSPPVLSLLYVPFSISGVRWGCIFLHRPQPVFRVPDEDPQR